VVKKWPEKYTRPVNTGGFFAIIGILKPYLGYAMKIVSDIIKEATSSSAGPVPRAIATIMIIQLYVLGLSFWRGLDGTCQVSKFQWDIISNYGCSGGLFVRGFFEKAPQPPSLERNAP